MKVLRFFLILILPSSFAFAQESYQVVPEESSLIIKGTSSLHDWESTVEDFSGSGIFFMNGSLVEGVENLGFSAVTESIKSGKRVMDKKTRGALDSKNYPQIEFVFSSIAQVGEDSLEVAGTLSLAGVTNEITVAGAYQVGEDGSIIISGLVPINMEDYGVKPPTAMVGTLKTGKDVEVEYQMRFQLTNPSTNQ
ncbi:MAG: YceI family protein [Balneola sp.]|nr:MAG: YceI family protein [Balneola sp.]